MKCDRCSKEAIGYTSQQMHIYCEDHEQEVLDIESKYYDYLAKCQEEEYAASQSNTKKEDR